MVAFTRHSGYRNFTYVSVGVAHVAYLRNRLAVVFDNEQDDRGHWHGLSVEHPFAAAAFDFVCRPAFASNPLPFLDYLIESGPPRLAAAVQRALNGGPFP